MTETGTLTDSTFLNRLGVETKVAEVVTKKECWFVPKEGRWVLAHAAVKKIAAIAGISKNYDIEESKEIQPSYKNELEHIVRVTIHCRGKVKGRKKGCVHDELDDTLTVTGEANKINTPVRGRGYLRKMAEKRAYDVAVLEHLDLYDTTFSEEESETMVNKDETGVGPVEISNVDLEALGAEITVLVGCSTLKDLQDAEPKLAELRANRGTQPYTETQEKFLVQLKEDRKANILGAVEEESGAF